MWNTFSQVAGALIGEDEPPSPEETLRKKEELIGTLQQTVQELELKLAQKDKELEEQAGQFEKVRLKNKARITQLTNQIKPCDQSKPDSAGDYEATHRGKVLLLKKQLEECRHQLVAAQHSPPVSLACTQTDEPLHDQENSKVLELIDYINRQETTVLELQEHLKEKDEVIQARTQAVNLLKNLSRRGEMAESELEVARQQLREFQERCVGLEQERSSLEAREAQLKAETEKLDTARYNMAATNAELQSRLVLYQQDNLEQQEEIKRLTTENEELAQKLWDLEAGMSSASPDLPCLPPQNYKPPSLDSGNQTSPVACSFPNSSQQWSLQFNELTLAVEALGHRGHFSLEDPDSIQHLTQLLKDCLLYRSRLEELENNLNNLLETFSIPSLEHLHKRLGQDFTIIEGLKMELEKFKMETDQLQFSCASYKARIEELEEENANLLDKEKYLSSKLEMTESQLQDRIDHLTSELAQNSKHFVDEKGVLDQKIAQLFEQIDLKEKQFQIEREINLALKVQIEETRQKALDSEVTLRTIVGPLQEDLLKIKSELATKCLEVESLAATLEAFDLANLKMQLPASLQESGELASAIQERDDYVHQLGQAISTLSDLKQEQQQLRQQVLEGLKVLASQLPNNSLGNLVEVALKQPQNDGQKFINDYNAIISQYHIEYTALTSYLYSSLERSFQNCSALEEDPNKLALCISNESNSSSNDLPMLQNQQTLKEKQNEIKISGLKKDLQILEEENESLKLFLQEKHFEENVKPDLDRICKELKEHLSSLEHEKETLEQKIEAQTEAFSSSVKDLTGDIKGIEVELKDLWLNSLNYFNRETHQELSELFKNGIKAVVEGPTKENVWLQECSGSKLALSQLKEAVSLIWPRIQQRLEELKAESKDLKSKNEEISKQLNTYANHLEESQATKETLLTEFNSQLKDLKTELIGERKKFQEQENCLEEIKNQINHFMEMSNGTPLQDGFDLCKETLQKILLEYSEMSKNYSSNKEKLKLYETEIQSLFQNLHPNEILDSGDHLAMLREILSDRLEDQKVLEELKRQNSSLEENVQSCIRKETSLESKALSLIKALEDSIKEREALWDEIQECKQQNTDLSAIVLNSQEELDTVRKKIEQIQTLSAEIETLNQENQGLKQHIEDLQEQNSLLSESLESKIKSLKAAQQQLDENTCSRQAWEDEKLQLTTLFNAKEASLSTLNSCFKLKDQECTTLKSNVKNLSSICSSFTEKNLKRKEEQHEMITDFKAQQAILGSKIDSLENELEEKEILLKHYSEKIDKLKEEILYHQNENDSLQKEISAIKKSAQNIHSQSLLAEPSNLSRPDGEITEAQTIEEAPHPKEDQRKEVVSEHLIQSNKKRDNQGKDLQDNEHLRSQLAIAKVKMSKMLLKLKSFREQNVKLQAEMESSVSFQEFSTKLNEAEELQQNLLEKEYIIVSMSQQMEHHRSHYQYETAQLQKEIIELKTLQEVLEEKNSAYKQALQDQESKLDEAYNAMRLLVQEKAALEGKINRLQAELTSLEEQCLSLKQQLLCVANREQQLQQRHANEEELNKLLMTDNQNYQAVLQDLQTANQKLEADLTLLRHQSKPHESQDEHLIQLTQKNQRLEEEIAMVRAQLKELEKGLETQPQRLSQILQETNATELKQPLTMDATDMAIVRTELEAKVSQLEHNNLDLSSKLEKACEGWAQKEAIWMLEAEQFKEREEAFLQELSSQESLVKALTAQVQQSQEELDHWRQSQHLHPRINEMQPDILAHESPLPTALPTQLSPTDPQPAAPLDQQQNLLPTPSPSISSSSTEECRVLIDEGPSPPKGSFLPINRLLQTSRFFPSAKRFY